MSVKSPVRIEDRAIATIRSLAMDAVEKAQSGHPGMPMGAAPMAYAIWSRFLRFDPEKPRWPGRDRFVLSAGHGSMLLYALLHLTGYDLPLSELKRFRQWGSMTPGHPEYGHTPGVETTTGPLGQGFATGVGMAIAERWLAAQYNRDGFPLIDWRVFGICSDGDLMEGVSQEAASLAGHLKLGNLVYLYDDNHISIEGQTEITFTEDIERRFAALGWHTDGIEDGNDLDAIQKAISRAVSDPRPSLIRVRTHIAYGSPHDQDSPKAHGTPLGAAEVKATKEAYGWPTQDFYVPEDVREHMEACSALGRRQCDDWERLFKRYREVYPTEAAELDQIFAGPGAIDVSGLSLPEWHEGAIATRNASGEVLQTLADVPMLLGGSADLSPSTETRVKAWGDFPTDPAGRIFHFGVREHAMGAAVNGMCLTGLRAFGATFLIFSDYMRPAIRLSALMGIPSLTIFTHDSIGLGEDGPTHQSVEHAASLRLIPNLEVWRPCDAAETALAWTSALDSVQRPSALLLSRQALPAQTRDAAQVQAIARGGYVLSAPAGARATILATGSEVGLAMQAQQLLAQQGIGVRVVSLPSSTRFDRQDAAYRAEVLGTLPRIGVEAGVTCWWGQYGCVAALGVDSFGESAPAPALFEHFGLTAAKLAARVREVLDA